MIKRILLLLIVLVIVFATFAIAKTLDEINTNYAKQVNAELQRQHELKLAEKQAETLGKLEQLRASNVTVYNSARSSVTSKLKNVNKLHN